MSPVLHAAEADAAPEPGMPGAATQVTFAVPATERVEALVTDMSNTKALWVLYKQNDHAAAAAMARPLAEQGSASAQYILSMLLADGHGVARDTAAAERWLKLAADQELPEAWDRLAANYRRGEPGDATRKLVRGALARSAAANVGIARYQAARTQPAQFALRPGDGAAQRYWDERERYFTKVGMRHAEGGWVPSSAPERLNRLPAECRPQRAPVAQMRALGVSRLEGYIDAYIGSGNRIDAVAIQDVSDERLRLLAFDLFNDALHADRCVVGGAANVSVRIPFRFVLE